MPLMRSYGVTSNDINICGEHILNHITFFLVDKDLTSCLNFLKIQLSNLDKIQFTFQINGIKD